MNVEKVFVVGGGLMGAGIAQVCAQAGIHVTICDVNEEILERARKGIRWSVGKLVDNGKLEGPTENVMARLETTTDHAAAARANVIIEAVFEKAEVKWEVLTQVGRVAKPEAIFGTNTSAIPITELAAACGRPERFLGLHFFSPVPMMQAVEVVKGVATSDAAFAAGFEFVRQIGKEPIRVLQDVPGFIVNRVNLPSNIEAMRLVEQGVATCDDVDRGLRLATGRKMGPFETGDLVGLDVTYGALMALYEETKDARWYPPMILRRKVKAGHLGRKAGLGWYRYDSEGRRVD